MERGYVKLWRAIDQNELLDNDNNAYIVFSKLLTRVNRFTGAYTTGRNKFSSICNMKPSTLYGVLQRLERSSIIRLEGNTNSTTIFICNWATYQQDDDRSPNESRGGRVTIQEKKDKEKKKNIVQRDVLGILNRVTKRNFIVEPAGIEKTKAKFSDEQIETALKNMWKDDWHKPRMSSLKSDYLLRASTIDQFKDMVDKKTEYILPGSVLKPTAVKEPGLTRKQMLEKEYQNG